MVNEAKGASHSYSQNDEDIQTVRVWGDTAVVTAKLWEKGTTTAEVIRSQVLVQRYLRAHVSGVEICVWSIFATVGGPRRFAEFLVRQFRRRAQSGMGNMISTSRSVLGSRIYRAACIP